MGSGSNVHIFKVCEVDAKERFCLTSNTEKVKAAHYQKIENMAVPDFTLLVLVMLQMSCDIYFVSHVFVVWCSEFEELEAVPTMAVMDGPLEPLPSTAANANDVSEDLAFMNFFSVCALILFHCFH